MFVHLFVLKLSINARMWLLLTSQEVCVGVDTKPQNNKDISEKYEGNRREFSTLCHV
jgi:hypothetical protein